MDLSNIRVELKRGEAGKMIIEPPHVFKLLIACVCETA